MNYDSIIKIEANPESARRRFALPGSRQPLTKGRIILVLSGLLPVIVNMEVHLDPRDDTWSPQERGRILEACSYRLSTHMCDSVVDAQVRINDARSIWTAPSSQLRKMPVHWKFQWVNNLLARCLPFKVNI